MDKIICPKCGEVDEIQIVKSVAEIRVWDGECYELIETEDNDDTEAIITCTHCGNICEGDV